MTNEGGKGKIVNGVLDMGIGMLLIGYGNKLKRPAHCHNVTMSQCHMHIHISCSIIFSTQ